MNYKSLLAISAALMLGAAPAALAQTGQQERDRVQATDNGQTQQWQTGQTQQQTGQQTGQQFGQAGQQQDWRTGQQFGQQQDWQRGQQFGMQQQQQQLENALRQAGFFQIRRIDENVLQARSQDGQMVFVHMHRDGMATGAIGQQQQDWQRDQQFGQQDQQRWGQQ